jgi:hypothetical protein
MTIGAQILEFLSDLYPAPDKPPWIGNGNAEFIEFLRQCSIATAKDSLSPPSRLLATEHFLKDSHKSLFDLVNQMYGYASSASIFAYNFPVIPFSNPIKTLKIKAYTPS